MPLIIENNIVTQYQSGNSPCVIVPEGVTAIGRTAFGWFEDFKMVQLPEGLTTIEYMAFYECGALEEVIFPSTLKKIGESAFTFCEGLEKIVIPDGTEEIDTRAFSFCPNLRELHIPDSVTRFGAGILFYSKKAVIYASKDSEARRYAKKHRIKFKEEK